MSQPLPRYTQHPIHHDPLDRLLAKREAELTAARTAIAAGHTPDADPTDLRGIPVIARGTTGTSPGTDPYQETARRHRWRKHP
jgi:hypothetical protein